MVIYFIEMLYFFINIITNQKITKIKYEFLQLFMIILLLFIYKMVIDWTEY